MARGIVTPWSLRKCIWLITFDAVAVSQQFTRLPLGGFVAFRCKTFPLNLMHIGQHFFHKASYVEKHTRSVVPHGS
jgi:hypothetical protein